MAHLPRVLGAGHDDRYPDLVFLSLEDNRATGGSSRYYIDRTQGLIVIRTLAAALQKIEEA